MLGFYTDSQILYKVKSIKIKSGTAYLEPWCVMAKQCPNNIELFLVLTFLMNKHFKLGVVAHVLFPF